MSTPRTYGRLVHGTDHEGRLLWGIRAQPHVAMRIKRMFPRVEQGRKGDIYLRGTQEVARDLEWLLERFPLELSPETAAVLRAEAEAHRAAEETVAAILEGYRPPDSWQAPARPARDYQQQAADIVHAMHGVLIGDPLGLGKSFTSLLVLRDPAALPAIVACPTHLPRQWLKELGNTLPWLHGHIVTGTKPYDPATRRGSGGQQPDVWIIPYSRLAGWAHHLHGKINTLIFDEVQELRNGTNTAKGRAAALLGDDSRYRVGLSATPVYNYGDEAWEIYDILAPGVLGSREEFLREWGGGERGQDRRVKVANPRALGTYLRDAGLLVARTRAEVGRELSEPVRVTQEVDTDQAIIDQVAGDVSAMAELLLSTDSDPKERWHAAGQIDWRMREATGIAKAPYVAEFVRLLLESERQVVLWGWHRAVYDIWMERLKAFNPVLYTGSETTAGKGRSAEAFISGRSRVLIMSLRSGAGLDGLQEVCNVGVFGELDWSPGVHNQCEGRLAREGQENEVVTYFMASEGGTDPLMIEVLGVKAGQAEPMMNPDAAAFAPVAGDVNRARLLAASVLDRARRRSGQLAVA
ncbi:DEAD/DEAH box helicase [Streptosporangium sp. NPDC051023]|uniref:DEAD/DEAH box helicase n=1 Tax=Streptosporangium sp. NPDC051023 TaxID=3155410 RepID=UPI00344D35B1